MNKDTLIELLALAEQAAVKAGAFVLEASQNVKQLNIEQKTPRDYVSEVDRGSERIIIDLIQQRFPLHTILGEEYGEQAAQKIAGTDQECYTWVVDPLDGTTNFLRGIAHYAISIAVTYQQRVIVGVVYDPAKKEMFSAAHGQGATLNGNDIQCSDTPEFDGALLATGVPFSGECLAELDAFQLTMEQLLAKKSSGIRRLGSAALDLAYVAAGRYEGYWEAKLKPWDIAAGALLVEEAAGNVGDFSGQGAYLDSGDIVAANTVVFNEIVKVTKSSYNR